MPGLSISGPHDAATGRARVSSGERLRPLPPEPAMTTIRVQPLPPPTSRLVLGAFSLGTAALTFALLWVGYTRLVEPALTPPAELELAPAPPTQERSAGSLAAHDPARLGPAAGAALEVSPPGEAAGAAPAGGALTAPPAGTEAAPPAPLNPPTLPPPAPLSPPEPALAAATPSVATPALAARAPAPPAPTAAPPAPAASPGTGLTAPKAPVTTTPSAPPAPLAAGGTPAATKAATPAPPPRPPALSPARPALAAKAPPPARPPARPPEPPARPTPAAPSMTRSAPAAAPVPQLTPAMLKEAMQRSETKFQRCIQEGWGSNVTIDVVVAQSGTVQQAELFGPLAQTETGRCLVEQVRKVRFPAFTQGESKHLVWSYQVPTAR